MNKSLRNRIEALERQTAGPRVYLIDADDPLPEMHPGDVVIVDDIPRRERP